MNGGELLMLIAIILIYICYYFKFPLPIILVAWCNLFWQIAKIYLGFFQVVDKDEE